MSYVYRMVPLSPVVVKSAKKPGAVCASEHLEQLVQHYAVGGWEFFRMDSIEVYHPEGCLSSLFGRSGYRVQHYVVTFRRLGEAR